MADREPAMSPDKILEELSRPQTDIPRDVLIAADAHREALVEPLLEVLAAVADAYADLDVQDEVDADDQVADLFGYALYLLAKWREPRALPGVRTWLSLPDERAYELSGDITTMDGPRILASVCGGDLEGIKTLIRDQEADEYGRSAGIGALVCLTLWGELPRESVAEYFHWLAREGLEREPGMAWNALCESCVALGLVDVFPDLHGAFAAGLIDTDYVPESDLEDVDVRPPPLRSEPFTDIADAIAWWAEFADDAETDADGGEEVDDAAEDFEDALRTAGRNEPCPCGSGKKFKKCHGG